MLQKHYTPELIDLVQELAEGEELYRSTIEAIIVSVESQMGPIGITPYNIRQIINMVDIECETVSDEEMAEEIINKSYDTSFVKTFKRVKERDYIKKSRLLGSSIDFLEHLQTYIEGYRPHKLKEFKPVDSDIIKKKVIALTDLHLGKQNSELISERLTQIVYDTCKDNITHIDIFCIGDLVETLVQGGMHDGQIESMDQGYGFHLLMGVVNIIESFILFFIDAGISVNFYGLSGNHDRLTKDREGDKARLGGLVIYELVKRGLVNCEGLNIEIIQDYIYKTDIDGIRYIVAHGDMARIPNRQSSDIAWVHGDNTKTHNVILHGHLHNVSITEEKNITKIGLPGLAGKDQYATKELDLHSEPGYVEIVHNGHGSVDINIKRLQND